MSRLEDRLRGAFRADAQTVKPDSIPALTGVPSRPVAGRARLFMPVAAALATAAVAAGVWVTSSLPLGRAPHHGGVPSSGHPTSPTGLTAGPLPGPVLGEDGQQAPRAVPASAPAPGAPRFFVTEQPANVPDALRLVVRDTGTGKVTGTIAPPRGTDFGSVTATAGNRTFLATAAPDGGQVCLAQSQLYQFQLNSSGQPGPLVALHITVPGGVGDLAITPDGRTIAYVSGFCGGRHDFGVIDLATRQVRVWSGNGIGIGSPIFDLSLSADGHLLVFTVGEQARILNTRAAAGSILSRSRILSSDSVYWAALARGDSSFYSCAVSPTRSSPSQKSRATYFWQAIGSAQRHFLVSSPNLFSPECMANLDPSGRYLLIQFPTPNPSNGDSWVRPVILDLQSGRTTSINAPAYYGPLTVAW